MLRNSKAWTNSAPSQILRHSLRGLDYGSASVMAIGVLGALAVLVGALGFSFTTATKLVNAQLVTDSVALATADTLAGAIAGYPCEVADLVANKNGASLTTCRIVGLVAEISTTTSLGPFQILRWAKAG